LSLFSLSFIDNFINFTGIPLLAIDYIFSIFFYVSLSIILFLSFDALGLTIFVRLVHSLGGNSELQLQRVSNLVVPIFRVLGASVSLITIYRLLVVVGLPSATVLAFSAVPVLAIGLGASKLLGNLFGGLSIQTDRPVRVGEFCQIGETLGFVTKIGMRSLVLQTLDSRVNIPNSIVDEQTIINFSRRDSISDESPTQSLLVRVAVTRMLNSDQVADLLLFARLALADIIGVQEPLVSIEEEQSEGCTILCHVLVAVRSWDDFIVSRERILLRLEQVVEQVVEQVYLSQRSIGVSYDTSADQLDRIPDLIRDLVESDPLLKLMSCRLMNYCGFQL
jgi:MscS family membrane protein